MHPKRTPSVILFVLLALLLATTSLYAAPSQRVIPADEDIPALPQTADSETAAKIQSAMSAAPLAVSLHATIMDWPAAPGGPMTTLRDGDNGYTCTPDNPSTSYPDPVCRDAVWAAFLAARMAGEEPEINTVGIAYMLQGGTAISYEDPTILKLPEGQDWIQEKPHLMLLFPEKLDPAEFSTSPDSATPWIMWEGTPYEHLMIPLAWEANQPQDNALQSALSAAPLDVAQGATIMNFPAEAGGAMTMLQEGDNGYTCTPDNPGSPYIDPVCRDATWAAFLAARLAGEEPEINTIGISYMLQGGAAISYEDPTILKVPEGEAWIQEKPHLMLLFPYKLNPADFSTSPDSDTPWIMWEGTPYEHLMIPFTNGLSDAQVERALLPLPESLRASANIVGFDSDWNQVMVREGSSDMNCVAFAPFMAIQYAVCEHKSSEPFWVMGMQLRAGGMAQADIDQARIDAMVDGTLEIPVVGAARYFLLGGRPQNLSSLMAVHLPHATSESTGFSTEPDNYRPWLMDAGTPNAHVMMPGN
ncbi:MAG: hypothetical protein KF753_21040 [Caldilineaceae bacterium]|nr:hypothetical protein [Caldilineaceae bacterium]